MSGLSSLLLDEVMRSTTRNDDMQQGTEVRMENTHVGDRFRHSVQRCGSPLLETCVSLTANCWLVVDCGSGLNALE